MPPDLYININLSNNSIIDKELPNNINKDNKDYSNINNQDLTIAYNKVIGGSKEEVLLLNILGEDRDIQYNNLEVLIETYLDIFNKESSKEIKVISLKEPSINMPEALKALVIAIRLPKAKQTCGEKKGKDSVEIDGRLYEYYNCKQCLVFYNNRV